MIRFNSRFTANELEIRDGIRRVYNSALLRGLKEKPYEQLRRRHGFTDAHINGIPKMNVIEGAAATAFACLFAENRLLYDGILSVIHLKKEIIGVAIASGNNIDKKVLEEILAEGS